MSKKPIAIIGSIDPERDDYYPALKKTDVAFDAARALGKELARAKHPIMVFSSNPSFIESHIVEGYVKSGQAEPRSITVLYPREKDAKVHGAFPEQLTHEAFFNLQTDPHKRWEVSYYQSLTKVKGVLMMGGGPATLIMGLMALANRVPTVSVACFGGNAEEIWATTMRDKSWIDAADYEEMGRSPWSDGMAETLVSSFDKQQANLDRMAADQAAAAAKMGKDRERRSMLAIVFIILGILLTALGAFFTQLLEGNLRLIIYAFCFIAVPLCAGIAGSMYFTLRMNKASGSLAQPPSIKETAAHGLGAGLGSAILFFVSQITANRDIKSLGQAVIEDVGGLDILLLFSFIISLVAGLTYEAVFSKWEAIDTSRSGVIEAGKAD